MRIRSRALAVTAVGGLVGLAAACSASSLHPSTASRATGPVPTTLPAPAPATTSSAAGGGTSASGSGCLTAQLGLSVQGPTGATGEVVYTVVFANRGTTTCSLTGFPAVSFLGAAGTQVGAPAEDSPGAAVSPVTLAPGSQASATITLDDPDVYGCPSAPVTLVRVAPPGQTAAAELTLPRPTSVCTAPSPGASGQIVPGTVTPVQAGAGSGP